jgi:2'-5' RNA ligase
MALEKKKTIILTLILEETAQSFFNEKRETYFPAHANFTDAHVTLFHSLPNRNFINETLEEITKKTTTLEMEVTKVFYKNNFIAYEINCAALLALHKNLQNIFLPMLSKKDLKILWPHVTIQNKTTNYKAEKNYAILQKEFIPFSTKALGIACWYFSGNEWEKYKDYYFDI